MAHGRGPGTASWPLSAGPGSAGVRVGRIEGTARGQVGREPAARSAAASRLRLPAARDRRPDRAGPEIRAVDATTVTETGGAGTGGSFRRFPVAAGDHLIGDLGHSAASGIGRGSGHGHRCHERGWDLPLRVIRCR